MDDIDNTRQRQIRADIYSPSVINAVDVLLEKERDSHNTYSSHKSVSMEFRTTDVILYYFGIIYVIFQTHLPDTDYHWTELMVLVLLSVGMIVQLTIGFMIFLLLKTTRDKVGRRCSATRINDTVLLLSGISTVINGLLNLVYSGGIASTFLQQVDGLIGLNDIINGLENTTSVFTR